MERLLALAVVLALSAGATQAKTAYCTDPTTHKRISCKTLPAAASTPSKPVAATTPTAPAYPAPAKKPSMFAGMMKPKPAATTPAAPMQSPVPATRMAASTASMASGGRKTPNCTKGKLCGGSCIKATDVCHKPG